MRKHSKPRNHVPDETIGIDLGDKISRYCIVDHGGAVVEEGTFRNQAARSKNTSPVRRAA